MSNKTCAGAGEHQGGTQGGASWMNRGVCHVCGKRLVLTPSGRIPRHVPQEAAAETVPAYELVGSEGIFRLPGGRTTYEAVMYNDATQRSDRIRLVKLEARQSGLHQIERYVDWEQDIEVVRNFTDEYEVKRQAEITAYEAQP